MPDQLIFEPEKLVLRDYKILDSNLHIPENFDIGGFSGYLLEHRFQLAFSVSDKLARADFTITAKTESKGANTEEATMNFRLVFIYTIDNLEKLAHKTEHQGLQVDPLLANMLASVTYSTTRGILLMKVQGTIFQTFTLPIISSDKLLNNQKTE